jgi:apurinic endonuclease APN1
MARPVGLHIRSNKTISEVLEKAERLNLPLFQCFLRQQSGAIIEQKPALTQLFRRYSRTFTALYVHGSYRINLADHTREQHPALKQELHWAKKLGFTHMILHPGASSFRERGIDSIVRNLNLLIPQHPTIQFVLENVAFAGNSIGGSLDDLHNIKSKLDNPEKLGFCIDTAHAFSYWYNIREGKERLDFIHEIDKLLDINSVKLIHINDTESELESRHDIHCRIGQGVIGLEPLKQFALDKRISKISLLLELPALAEADELHDLNIVRTWDL